MELQYYGTLYFGTWSTTYLTHVVDDSGAPIVDTTPRDTRRRVYETMPNPSTLWRYTGDDRPPFATPPGEGEESVWDYPRPPRLAPDSREVTVRIGDVELARTRRAVRLLETASPPTFYIPFADARRELLVASPESRATHCEWKGRSRYWSVVAGDELLRDVAWSYPSPNAPFAEIANCFSVYPARLSCFVDGERVRPQEGGFYGGWVTNEIVGPWKGGSGTSGW